MLFYLQFTLLALLQSDIDTDPDSDFGRRVLVGTLLQFERRTVHIGHRAPAELCTRHNIEIEPGGTRTLARAYWWDISEQVVALYSTKKEAGVAGRWRSPRPRE